MTATTIQLMRTSRKTRAKPKTTDQRISVEMIEMGGRWAAHLRFERLLRNREFAPKPKFRVLSRGFSDSDANF